MRITPLLLAVLLVTSVVAFIVSAPAAQAAPANLSGQLIESEGPTNAFGGGNYRFIEFGSDAAFGIVWGNATHANNIYVVAIKARYLGVGQVYNSVGKLVDANEPVKVYTIYAAKLLDILEYQDGAGTGIANYSRGYTSSNDTFSNYTFNRPDVAYKYTDLKTNWAASPVDHINATTYQTWSFSLNATHLAYYNVTNRQPVGGAPAIVNFTFHLNASLVQDNNVPVPQWNVTVTQVLGHYVLTNVAAMPQLTLASVKTVHYDLKWDQLIQNWAYDSRDSDASTRRLLLEVGMIVANYVPPGVLAGWRIIHQLGDDGQAQYNSTAGPQTAGNGTGGFTAPKVFKSPNLDFGGAWTKIGRFLWTSNSTVDGANRNVTAQIMGGWGFFYADIRGAFYGFVLLVGLNYYGGNAIVHDPTVTSDVTTGLQFQSSAPSSPSGVGGGVLLLGIVILVVLVAVGALMVVRGRKKRMPPAIPPAPPPMPPQH